MMSAWDGKTNVVPFGVFYLSTTFLKLKSNVDSTNRGAEFRGYAFKSCLLDLPYFFDQTVRLFFFAVCFTATNTIHNGRW